MLQTVADPDGGAEPFPSLVRVTLVEGRYHQATLTLTLTLNQVRIMKLRVQSSVPHGGCRPRKSRRRRMQTRKKRR